MKTLFTLNTVRKIQVPTMYFSNDSDSFTMTSRVLSMLSGQTTATTEEWVQNGTHQEYATKLLRTFDHVKWSFHSGPSLDHIEQEMNAYAEIHGSYPQHTIIDILMNVDYDGAGEQNYWGLMAELHDLSRKWETALGIVHHSSESVKGEPCPPRHAIMGKANQLPVLIQTLAPRMGFLDIAIVKNRFGESDLTGRTFFSLPIEPWCSRVLEEEGNDTVVRGPDGTGPDSSGLVPGSTAGEHRSTGEGVSLGDTDPFAAYR